MAVIDVTNYNSEQLGNLNKKLKIIRTGIKSSISKGYQKKISMDNNTYRPIDKETNSFKTKQWRLRHYNLLLKPKQSILKENPLS